MSLPSSILDLENRAIGMGVFFTMFYLSVVIGPLAGGAAAEYWGGAQVTFDLGAAMLIVCCAALWLFEWLAKAMRS